MKRILIIVALGFLAWSVTYAPTVAAPSGEKNISPMRATVAAGGKTRLWFNANYGPHCGSAGLPLFSLTTKPVLGEVTTDEIPFTVPSGQNCAGNVYRGLEIWYIAGPVPGSDRFTYTIEFPHETNNPEPSKGPRPGRALILVTAGDAP